jgi:hypothetical protein
MGDRSLYDTLDESGVSAPSGLFRIEVEDEGVELEFPGWFSVPDEEEDMNLMLVPAIS